ncbi:MAG TPA: NAD-dependent succinate-semialdehyde dehydrogenase [Longimicrobiales bacterium]|nr:NAD-dependent succinate-semialdehyde dehydrogenase [Longimicrobiales bacterium]
MKSVNPATGEELERFEELSDDELEGRLARAEAAFQRYRRTPLRERAAKLSRAADILEREAERLGALMTREMGKPIGAAVAEAQKCAKACRHYAEIGEEAMADRVVETEADRSFVRYLPIGPVLAIMPWNFPFWQVFRFAAPALTVGNVGLLKHASNVPGCALAIEDVLRRAGFDGDEFQSLLIGSARVGRVLDDARVRAATLTGSTPAGSAVASQAGKRIKKTVLELGGSDPFVVMPSADIEATARIAVQARVINNGQSCIAAKRFIVHQAVYDAFLERFVHEMESLRVGDPMDPATQVGPLAMEQILQTTDRQVSESVKAGACLLTGGKRLDRPGWFYAPTVLADVPDGAPAEAEEIFAPVASVFRVRDIDEAIRRANASIYGLGSSVWTRDEAEIERFANEIEAGMTFVNAMVASDPRLPFGGVKESGYGRELAIEGLREFANIKTVYVKRAPGGGGEKTE